MITLIKGGMYDELNQNVGEALQKRSDVRMAFLSSAVSIDIRNRIFRGSIPALSMIAWILSLTRYGSLESTVLLLSMKTIV